MSTLSGQRINIGGGNILLYKPLFDKSVVDRGIQLVLRRKVSSGTRDVGNLLLAAAGTSTHTKPSICLRSISAWSISRSAAAGGG